MGIFKTREPSAAQLRRQELQDAIADIRCRMEVARNGFENVSEPELVDATTFEIKALEARYSYLLRLARQEGCDEFPVFKQLR